MWRTLVRRARVQAGVRERCPAAAGCRCRGQRQVVVAQELRHASCRLRARGCAGADREVFVVEDRRRNRCRAPVCRRSSIRNPPGHVGLLARLRWRRCRARAREPRGSDAGIPMTRGRHEGRETGADTRSGLPRDPIVRARRAGRGRRLELVEQLPRRALELSDDREGDVVPTVEQPHPARARACRCVAAQRRLRQVNGIGRGGSREPATATKASGPWSSKRTPRRLAPAAGQLQRGPGPAAGDRPEGQRGHGVAAQPVAVVHAARDPPAAYSPGIGRRSGVSTRSSR